MDPDDKAKVKELNIGSKIKSLREKKRFSIQNIAEKTGVSALLLSQIENEVVTPPIATLLKISRALDTSIGYFFIEEPSEKKAVVVREGERRRVFRRSHEEHEKIGYFYDSLAYPKAEKSMEPFLVEFEKKEKKDLIFFNHKGEEFIHVLEGILEFNSDDERHELTPGDSLYFDSNVPHAFRALGKENAKALVVIYSQE
ncbi:MAG: XRE family transcriptional regulator [Thermodesulfobacteriota bacterium]